MLAPVYLNGKRYWVEFSINGTLWTPTNAITELRKLVLEEIEITGVYEDLEILAEIQKAMEKIGSTGDEAIKRLSKLFGIPKKSLAELLEVV